MFGYRSNLVRRVEREHIDIVHPHARTPPPQIGPDSQVTKMTIVKASTDASVSKRILKSPNAKKIRNSTAVWKFTSAYMSCIDEGNDSQRLHESMQRIFRQLGFDDWYSSSKEPTNETDETIGNIISKIGLRPFFDYSVQLEPRKPCSKRTIIITKRTDFFLLSCASEIIRSLSSREKFNESKQSQESADNISTKQYSRCKKVVAEIVRLTSAKVTKNQSMIMAEDILNFERTFLKLSKQAVGKRIEINMTSENETASSTNFSLRTMLEKELRDINATLKDDIRVILECPDYYADLINFVSRQTALIPDPMILREPNTQEVTFILRKRMAIKNYVVWSYIRSMANVEGTHLHDLYMTYSFNTTNLTRSSAKKDVRKSCFSQLLKPETMLTAGTRLYIKYNFNKYDRKNLARMETVVGYPDWMLDDTVVDNLYRYIPLLKETTSFTEHIFWIQENSRYQELVKLSEEYISREFAAVALFSHPYYVERSDTLVLPAAALVPHYRRPPVPRALNFGSIGAMAAILMANAIDRFDTVRIEHSKGGLGGIAVTKEFWDKESKEIFCKHSSCLKNADCRDVEEKLKKRGEAHFTEYIGLRASFMALKNSVDNYTRPYLLRGADFNTEDKIFFLAFGNLYCPFAITKLIPTERSDNLVTAQYKETYQARLNDAVKGHYEFQEAYKCNATTDSCKLLPANFGSPKKG